MNGAPANGSNDLTFTLYTAASGGIVTGASNIVNDLAITNGLFTVPLNFGSAVFSGADLWMQVAVRPGASAGAYTNVTPRQQITSVPYALRALSFSGTIVNAQLSGTYVSPVTISNGANVFGGAFTGNGAGLTSLNATNLAGTVPAAALGNAWKLAGNAGANPTNGAFLGTTDNLPVEIRVNGERALRLEPNPGYGTVNLIGGSLSNVVDAGVIGATIHGGGSTNFGGSVYRNRVSGSYGTVGGGAQNTASGYGATVGGGGENTATEDNFATVGGGYQNYAEYGSTVSGGHRNGTYYFGTVGGGADNSSGNYGTVGGGRGNSAPGSYWGGATVGGGFDNTASGDYATVSGGQLNQAKAISSTVSGGYANTAYAGDSTVGGGSFNVASNTYATISGGRENFAGGLAAAVGGGRFNTNNGNYGVIPGGLSNLVGSSFSLASGYRAKATHTGAFVWADATEADFATTASNQFLIRATGGVGIGTTAPGKALQVGDATIPGSQGMVRLGSHTTTINNVARTWDVGVPQTGDDASGSGYSFVIKDTMDGTPANSATNARPEFMIKYGSGNVGLGTNAPAEKLHVVGNILATGTITPNSDRAAKTDFAPVDAASVLARVAALPLSQWRFKTEDGAVKHLGPMAQDFRAAFGLGAHETAIATVDADGVALAAIQGLNQKFEDRSSELEDRSRGPVLK